MHGHDARCFSAFRGVEKWEKLSVFGKIQTAGFGRPNDSPVTHVTIYESHKNWKAR